MKRLTLSVFLFVFICLPLYVSSQDFRSDLKHWPAFMEFNYIEWLYDPHYDENNTITCYTVGGNTFRLVYEYDKAGRVEKKLFYRQGNAGDFSNQRIIYTHYDNERIVEENTIISVNYIHYDYVADGRRSEISVQKRYERSSDNKLETVEILHSDWKYRDRGSDTTIQVNYLNTYAKPDSIYEYSLKNGVRELINRRFLQYEANQRIQTIVEANGDTYTYTITFDEKGRLLSQQIIRNNEEVILSGVFAYDKDGNTMVDKQLLVESEEFGSRCHRYISGVNPDGTTETAFFVKEAGRYRKTFTLYEERNHLGLPLVFIVWIEEGSGLKNHLKSVLTFDEERRCTSRTYYFWNKREGVWWLSRDSKKWIYGYNKKGLATKYVVSEWRNDEWYVKINETRMYNDDGMLLFKESLRKDEWDFWQSGRRNYYTYDMQGRMTRHYLQRWFSSIKQWKDTKLEKVSYTPDSVIYNYYVPGRYKKWLKSQTMIEHPDGTTTTKKFSTKEKAESHLFDDLNRFR